MKKITQRLTRAINHLERIQFVMLIAFLLTFTVGVFLRVVNRYVTHMGIPALQTITVFCFIWIIFLSPSIGIRRGSHFSFDILTEKAPPRRKNYLQLLGNLLCFIAILFIIKTGFSFFLLGLKKTSYAAAGLSMAWGYSSILIGGILMFLAVLEQILKSLLDTTNERRGR